MKKLLFLMTCCLLLISSILSCTAQELSEEMIKVVNDNIDNFFPLSSINETFGTKAQAVRGNIGTETATEASTDGRRNLLLYANPDGATEYAYIEKVNAGNLKNFYYEMDLIPNDLYPYDGGGCYMGYLNEFIAGVSQEEGVLETTLIVSDAIYLETYDANTQQRERTKLADFDGGSVKLRIVRLTGETLFYVDGKFIRTFHDGKVGPFQLRFGVTAFPNGEVVDCSFDNLAVRKVVP